MAFYQLAIVIGLLLAYLTNFENTVRESWKEIFRHPARRIVFIGAAIAVFSQIDGQNSVLSYAPEIFKQSGALGNSAFLQSVLIGIIFFIFTFLAISTVDKAGRRKILLYGSLLLFATLSGLAVCFYLKANSYVILLFVLAFAATYAASLGPVIWVIVSELFPNHIRGTAMGVATLALWIANYITTSMFPVMHQQR